MNRNAESIFKKLKWIISEIKTVPKIFNDKQIKNFPPHNIC